MGNTLLSCSGRKKTTRNLFKKKQKKKKDGDVYECETNNLKSVSEDASSLSNEIKAKNRIFILDGASSSDQLNKSTQTGSLVTLTNDNDNNKKDDSCGYASPDSIEGVDKEVSFLTNQNNFKTFDYIQNLPKTLPTILTNHEFYEEIMVKPEPKKSLATTHDNYVKKLHAHDNTFEKWPTENTISIVNSEEPPRIENKPLCFASNPTAAPQTENTIRNILQQILSLENINELDEQIPSKNDEIKDSEQKKPVLMRHSSVKDIERTPSMNSSLNDSFRKRVSFSKSVIEHMHRTKSNPDNSLKHRTVSLTISLKSDDEAELFETDEFEAIESPVVTKPFELASIEYQKPEIVDIPKSDPQAKIITEALRKKSSLKPAEQRLFEGYLDNLTEPPSSQIKVFLSSAFKDFDLEMNYIIQNYYDKIKKLFMNQYQKDFIIVDPRWSIGNEPDEQQLLVGVYLQEIQQTKDESFGPSFVTFLSHRYGNQLIPSKIDKSEFELIKKHAKVANIERLLEEYYQLDENSIKKKEYKLKLTNGLLKTTGKSDFGRATLTKSLIDIIGRIDDKEMSKEKKAYYSSSAIEQEIQEGILQEKEADLKCIAFFREIKGLDKTSDKSKLYQEEDETLRKRSEALQLLVEKKLSKNKHKFQVEWSQINALKLQNDNNYSDQIKNYLKSFGECFMSSLTKLVDDKSNKIQLFFMQKSYETELLHHAFLCNKLVKQVDEGVIDEKVNEYIKDETNDQPFILTGASGSGKSTYLANIVKKLKNETNVIIYRFMGTSRASSNMKDVIISILNQLESLFIYATTENRDIVNGSNENLVKLRELFKAKLQNSIGDDSRVIILLDAIDQLSHYDVKHLNSWFISHLPKNIKIIYSVNSNSHDILSQLQTLVTSNKKNYFEISSLPTDKASKLLSQSLENVDRTLDGNKKSSQWSSINQILSKSAQIYPLHIKLIFDIVKLWPSWHVPDADFQSCTTIKDTIKYLLKNKEVLYNKILFQRCIFYLTLFGLIGISESELEDILSIDDVVLNSVYIYNHPPVRRFQMNLWLMIKHEIKEYLLHKEADDISVISWFHSSFIEASQEYYKELFEPSATRDSLLMNVIDYFCETFNEMRSDGTNGKKKEFEYNGNGVMPSTISKLNGFGHKYAAFRNTKPQKIITYSSLYKKICNKRKLNELVRLISMLHDNSKKVELLKDHVHFDYEFMLAKCELNELDFVSEIQNEIGKLKQQLKNGQDVTELESANGIYSKLQQRLVNNPDDLNIELLSRLENRSKYTRKFAKPCGLMLLKAHIEDEITRTLFHAGSNGANGRLVHKFHLESNGPLVFIETIPRLPYEVDMLHVVDLTNSIVLIDSIKFKTTAFNIQILLDNYKTSHINEKIYIYYSNSKSVYSYHNLETKCISSFEDTVKRLFLLSSNHLLVAQEKSLVLWNNSKSYNKKQFSEKFNHEILIIETTIPKGTVFEQQFLDNVDTVTVLIGLAKTKLIKIYKFCNKDNLLTKVCEIDNLNWDLFEQNSFRPRESPLIIDESFNIDNLNEVNEEILTRFVLHEHENSNVFKTVDVYKNGVFKNDVNITIDEEPEGKNIELEGFTNGNVVLKKCNETRNWIIYIYSLGEKKIILKEDLKGLERVNFVNGLLVGQDYYDCLRIYKIENNRLTNIFSFQKETQWSFNELKHEIQIKNNKLIRIEPIFRSTLIEYDYLAHKSSTSIREDIGVEALKHVFDNEHFLCKVRRNDYQIQFSIINVIKQRIIDSFTYIDEGPVELIGCSNEYLVFANCKKSYIDAFKLAHVENSLKSIQIIEKKFFHEHTSQLPVKCHFDISDPERFILTLCNINNHSIEVNYIEKFNANAKTVTIFLDKLEIERSERVPLLLITSLNKYLIVFYESTNSVYFIRMLNEKILRIEVKMDGILNVGQINCIKNTDGLIINCSGFLYYIECDFDTNLIQKIKLRDYEVSSFHMGNEYLFVQLPDAHTTEVFKTSVLTKVKKLDDPIGKVYVKKSHCVSLNERYWVFENEKKLCVYRLENMKQVAGLRINENIDDSASSEKYLCIRSNSKPYLLIFEILDD